MNKLNEFNEIASMIDDGALITSGQLDHYNTMTIGWGMIGTIWRKKVFVAFVRPSRFTYEFIEQNDVFTISFFYPSFKQQLSYLGSRSGRLTNKVADVGFTPMAAGESVSFKEAYLTFICKKIYFQDMDANAFPDMVKNVYYAKGDVHRLYFGEIIDIIQKESNE